MNELFCFSNFLASVSGVSPKINLLLFLAVIAILLLALFACIKLTKRYRIYDPRLKREEHNKIQDEKAPVQV